MRYCIKPFKVTLVFLAVMFIAGCGQEALGYGFVIKNVSISRGYQVLNIRLQQELDLSQQARAALQHGVTLAIRLDLELRNDNNMTVVKREVRYFRIRYLPLSERYQLREGASEKLQAFTRLRHVLAAIGDLKVQMPTGPLPPGSYELRTRIRVDESQLPAPMQLPALFSSQWRHDSEWSVWPFEVNV